MQRFKGTVFVVRADKSRLYCVFGHVCDNFLKRDQLLSLNGLALVEDRVRQVIDAGYLEEIKIYGEVVSAGHAVSIHSVLANACFIFIFVVIRFTYDSFLASTFLYFAEKGDPLTIQLILNVKRSLDILHVNKLANRAHYILRICADFLQVILSLLNQSLHLFKLIERFSS